MLKDNFNLAYKNIRERMSRSILTLLGISIGIMAIISLMSLGEGMNQAVTAELSSLSDTMIVTVGSGFDIGSIIGGNGGIDNDDQFLTERDISDISRISGIKKISTQLSGGGILRFNSVDVIVSLIGMDSDVINIAYDNDDLYLGSLLDIGDQNKCVIGYKIAYEYFDNEISIGSRIKVNDKKIIVKGIFSQMGTGGIGNTDDTILLISRDFTDITGDSNITSAAIQVYNVNDVEFIADEVEDAINENHGDDDFATATSFSSIMESIQNIIGIIQMMLVAIASVALIVASIGIMNTMLTSVMERTREIGIMKAIGAENKDVMLIFIIEGIIVSTIGGVIGIVLGVFGSQGLSEVLSMQGAGPPGNVTLTPVITITAILLAVGVSLIVGVLSSLYPAWKAARMSPIEAVRYE